MQAVIYTILVNKNSDDKIESYKINFNFVVIDNYNQIYVFEVSNETMSKWYIGFEDVIKQANYHFSKKDFSLPYEFALKNVIL